MLLARRLPERPLSGWVSIRERRSKIISQPPIKARANSSSTASRPRSADTDAAYARLVSHWSASIGLDPRFFGTHALPEPRLSSSTAALVGGDGAPWTWGEHLPPSSAVGNSNMEGQLWVRRRRSCTSERASASPQKADHRASQTNRLLRVTSGHHPVHAQQDQTRRY